MAIYKCNKCGCENTSDARFCRKCNSKICPSCHKSNDNDATFCVYCGGNFTQNVNPGPRVSPSSSTSTSTKKDNEDGNMVVLGILLVIVFAIFIAISMWIKNAFPVLFSALVAGAAIYRAVDK